MMAALAISGVCNLASPNVHNQRDTRKSSDVLLSRMLKHGRTADLEVSSKDHGICGCGMENAVSTSGQLSRRTGSASSRYRMSQKKLSMNKKVRGFCMSEEKWGMDIGKIQRQKRRAALAALAVAGYVSVMLPASAAEVDFPAASTTVEALEAQFNGSTRVELEREIQIQRKEWELPSDAIDAIATAPSPTQSQQSLKIKDVDEEDSFYAWKQVQKEIEVPCVALVQDNEDDIFSAWKPMQREMGAPVELECVSPALLQSMEEDSFYAWRQVQKEIAPVPKSPVKKAVAASVAVAVAGSVAGAASAVAGSVAGAASVAGRAVASSGGTNAVATSLTVLQHSSLPGSTLLAKIVQHLGGGGVAGAIGATAVYPLDTIKTRMQAQSTEGKEPQYKDEIDCFKQLVAKEGPASLYSGLVPQLLGIAPEKAMKLTVNEALLSSLETMMPGARVWALEFIAGGGGGASQVVFTNPMEIVKVRLQTQKDGAPKKELWTIVKELGVKGLYDGAGVTLARDVPSSAIFFAIYTLLRGLYPEQSFLAGAIAAIPATILVTPMDIIKTRLQKEPAEGEQQFTDWWECLQDIVKNEGPLALFKGSLLRVLRTSPQFGITLMVYGILTDGS